MVNNQRFWKITAISLMIMNTLVIGVFAFMLINRTDKKPIRFSFDTNDPVFQIGSRLELSPEQRELMRDSNLIQQRESTKYELMKLRGALLQESRSENPNTELIDSLINEIANRHATMERGTLYGIRKLREISTPQQRERFNRMIDRMESKFEGRHKQRKSQGPNR